MKTRLSTILAAALLCSSSVAIAQDAESLVVPSFRKVNSNNYGDNVLQFKVADKGVHSISVLAKTYSRDGRVDRQIFELTPKNDRGAFPQAKGHRMWESDKIYASHDIWSKNKGNVDRVEFTYVVRKQGADGQRAPVESRHIYNFASGNDVRHGYVTGGIQRVGQNRGRGLDRMDARDVQAAMDRLAKRPPHARYTTLPGSGPAHPLHAERQLVKAINSVTKQAKANPGKSYFVRFSLYNQDSTTLSSALVAAHKAGVKVEGLTDWSQSTPRLSSKPAYDMLTKAGVKMYNMVRNSPRAGDISTNHTKIWIMGEMKQGKIARASTFDCSFNTEFGNYPKNQEAMTRFPNNRDVATVYNHIYQAMKGNAPLKLRVDPARAKFMVHHPLYPYVTPQGKTFDARASMYNFIGKGTKSLTMLDYVHADRDIAGATGAQARKGANVNVFLNAWKVKNHGGADNANYLRSLGAKVHLVWQDGSSPIHHKEGVANGKWVRGGSLNPGHWSFTSDETMYVIRSKKMGKQVQGQANRLAHNYAVEGWGGSQKPAKKTTNVQFEVRIPTNINPKDVAGVYFGVGGSPEAQSSWVKLTKATKVKRTRKNKVVYRGARRLPVGFNHHGKPVIVLKNGTQVWSKTNDTHFTVQRNKAGRMRIRSGFKK